MAFFACAVRYVHERRIMAQIANFTTGPRPKAPPRKKRERRKGDDPAYLALLRQCPCAVDRVYTIWIEPHHANHLQPGRGKGTRCPDRYCIPLSHARHMELHRHGSKRHDAVLREWGVDAEALANELWHIYRHTPDAECLDRMRKAVMRHTMERRES